MPVQVLIHAYDNPTLAAKHEEMIGRLMKKNSMSEKNPKPIFAVQEKRRKESEENKERRKLRQVEVMHREAKMLRAMLNMPPSTKRHLHAMFIERGIAITRNQMDQSFRMLQSSGLVEYTKKKDISYWFVSDKEAAMKEIAMHKKVQLNK